MYVKGRSIVVALALLVSSCALSGDYGSLFGTKSGQYFDLKSNFIKNPTVDNYNAVSSKLQAIENVIYTGPAKNPGSAVAKDRQKRVAAEKTWLASVNPVPTQGAIAGSSRARTQLDEANKLVDMLDQAVKNKDLDAAQTIYQNMVKTYPTLDAVDSKDKAAVLEQAKVSARSLQSERLDDIDNRFENAKANNDLPTMQSIHKELQKLAPRLGLVNEKVKQNLLARYAKDIADLQASPTPVPTPAPASDASNAVAQFNNIVQNFRKAQATDDLEAMRNYHNQANALATGQYADAIEKAGGDKIMDKLTNALIQARNAQPGTQLKVSQAQAQVLVTDLFEFLEQTFDKQKTAALMRIIKTSNAGDKQSNAELQQIVKSMSKGATKEMQQKIGIQELQDLQTNADWWGSRHWYSTKVDAADKLITNF